MADRWSSKAFVSYDGPDETGLRAEVKVVKGFGTVKAITPSDAGNSFKVDFGVDNTKYTPSGWAPKDSEVLRVCEEALESGESIHFRLETRRQKHVDRSIPIAEISTLAMAKDNIYKSLAVVKKEDGEWVISKFALTRMEEDPKIGGSASAYDYSLEELQGNKNAGASPVAAGDAYSEVEARLDLYFALLQETKDTSLSLDDKEKIVVTKALLSATYQALAVAQVEFKNGAPLRLAADLILKVMKHLLPLTQETLQDEIALQKWVEDLGSKAGKMWLWSIRESAKN